jgi:hypothetical protein
MKAEGILQIPFMRTAMRELISQGRIRLPQLEPADGKKDLAQDIALLESTVADTSNQAHKSLDGLLEIKNIRVHPNVRLRDFGRFMLKQAELTPGFLGSICDVREDQPRVLQFMVRCGYSVAATVPLYDSERNDIVLVKFFGDERIPIKMEAA